MNQERAASGIVREARRMYKKTQRKQSVTRWNMVYIFVGAVVIFVLLLGRVVNLQLVQGEHLHARSQNNKLSTRTVYPLRGVIYDRAGGKLAENIPAYNVYISLDEYKEDGVLDVGSLENTVVTVEELFIEAEIEVNLVVDEEMLHSVDDYKSENELLLAVGVDNEVAIVVKSNLDKLKGVYLDGSTKRYYTDSEAFAHIIGYVSKAGEMELSKRAYVTLNDTIGKSGVERQYDESLIGVKGKMAVEIDALGSVVSDTQLMLEQSQVGKSMYLTIDRDMQVELYELLKDGVNAVGARGAAAVVEDIHTGELLSLVSYPSYDNNKFIGGISTAEYGKLMGDEKPMFNRAISAQEPPGSIFKTLVLSSALDAGAINSNTVYVSSTNYTLSNGAPFYEYKRRGHGRLDVLSALAVSSNIYPCETIRNWDMEELVSYLDAYGVGKRTGIDLPGEEDGRLPSPENKIKLAEGSAPWLDAVWYPEGDACNSVIGQGITLVTPVQAANFAATIANGGDVHSPHVGWKYVWNMDVRDKYNQGYESADTGGDVICRDVVIPQATEADTVLDADSGMVGGGGGSLSSAGGFTRFCEAELLVKPVAEGIISNESLSVIRRGMREAVAGERGIIRVLDGTDVPVAAKTGTAEFGKRNSKGEYMHSHAWIIGFYPYDDPQYSFAFFMEDGGTSSNVAGLAREFIEWVGEN